LLLLLPCPTFARRDTDDDESAIVVDDVIVVVADANATAGNSPHAMTPWANTGLGALGDDTTSPALLPPPPPPLDE
jgi:hypothetical protein